MGEGRALLLLSQISMGGRQMAPSILYSYFVTASFTGSYYKAVSLKTQKEKVWASHMQAEGMRKLRLVNTP